MTAQAAHLADGERTAERLLASSAKNSYDPELDLDWNAPLADDKFYFVPERLPLYGTSWWERATPEQRIEHSRHFVAGVASSGIWFESILMQLLLRHVYRVDPRQRQPQYVLTEVADECRHIVMFGRMMEKLGTPHYKPPFVPRELGNLLKAVGWGPSMYAATLLGEEIVDRFQRAAMNDDRVQPMMRMVNRIHVVEEARHVRYAREEIVRSIEQAGKAELALHRAITAVVAFYVSRAFLPLDTFRPLGLDPRDGLRMALANPHWQQTMRWGGERLMAYLDELGMIGKSVVKLWRKSLLIP
ncbi:membrane protein [Longimycelium tulufanense]|uniref:Membrane protein n=1 Tax=Longimycelium tulufanense TaxID=907463 RepID=A0A8J3FST7_9PSEU|nr:diiron oxygenase [Longimycelium tulufanense]GGM42375.1 membrane protein [Longimycelium tulufanense]